MINFSICLSFTVARAKYDGEKRFFIDRDIKLPRESSKFLGYENIILLRGEYPFNTFTSQFGIVERIQIVLTKENERENKLEY